MKVLNSARRRSTSGRSSAIGRATPCTVAGGKRKTTRALLTLTERKTRKEIIIAIPNRKAETVVKALDALERKLGARRFRAIFKSITFDNGTEFAAAEGLERSCVNKRLPRTKVYFCHPYSSWERGTNENTNGMIRRRFPQGNELCGGDERADRAGRKLDK